MRNQNEYDILEIRDYYSSKNNPSGSTWVYDQVLSLSKTGYSPLVISPTPVIPLKRIFKNKFRLYDSPSIRIEDYKGTKVIRPPYFKIPNNKFVGLTLRNLSNCIGKYGNCEGIKLIHAHFGQNGVAALELKEKLNVPLITSFYGYDSGRLGKIYRPHYKELIWGGDVFLALSQDMKKDLMKLGFPAEKIIIHHLGVDFDFFNTGNIKTDKFTLLSVARLDPAKGIQYIIRAFKKFLERNPNEQLKIQYKIVGGGVYEKELKLLVKELQIESNVVFINNLVLPNSREIVINEMKKCDIFLLCSFTPTDGSKEGTPVVLMEAQACGKPCIATFHAGIPEVVINNKTGILTHEKDVNEIVNAIERLYFNDLIRHQYGGNANNHIGREFNNKKQMENLAGLFNSLI